MDKVAEGVEEAAKGCGNERAITRREVQQLLQIARSRLDDNDAAALYIDHALDELKHGQGKQA